jgi:uncharacterized protein
LYESERQFLDRVNTTGLHVHETNAGLEVRLHVQPRAKQSGIAGFYNGALKLKVTAPPVDDAANRAVLEYFSTLLEVPKSSLHILTGHKSREKTLQIRGLSLARFLSRIS